MEGDPEIFSHEVVKCGGWWKALSSAKPQQQMLVWPPGHCWGQRAGSALCRDVPWAFRLLQAEVEACVSSGTSIVASFFWVEIRSFLTQSTFTTGRAHPVNGREKEFDPILDASDSSATWAWLLDFSHLTKKSHLRVGGYSRCGL